MILGDFETLEDAKRVAAENAQPGFWLYDYDSGGSLVFELETPLVKATDLRKRDC